LILIDNSYAKHILVERGDHTLLNFLNLTLFLLYGQLEVADRRVELLLELTFIAK
jgi:hypothetical protein